MSRITDVIAISALDLSKGHRVIRRDRFGNAKPDFIVGDPFTTSGPERLQPLAFHTDRGVKVFAHCATIEVSTGRPQPKAGSKPVKDNRQNGKARRNQPKAGASKARKLRDSSR